MCGCASPQARQGRAPAARRLDRSRRRRSRRVRPRGAHSGTLPGPLHRRGATGAPAAGRGKITPERYAACDHVVTSRRGRIKGPVDEALAAAGLTRNVAVIVPSFGTALSTAAATDMVALIPASYFEHLRASNALRSFELPVPTGAHHHLADVAPSTRSRSRAPMAAGCRARGMPASPRETGLKRDRTAPRERSGQRRVPLRTHRIASSVIRTCASVTCTP